jgi:glycine cleavage system H lipoate-binding protein
MDFLATKGIEYLMVIGYLLALIPFWWAVAGWRRRPAAEVTVGDAISAVRGWFAVPDGFSYHRGHTWARPVGDGRYRVGVDDFAQRLLGTPDGIETPSPGERLQQGEAGLRLVVEGRPVDLLSPLSGEVVAVNPRLQGDPALLTADPYGDGWLMEVEADEEKAAQANLLPPSLARAWMEEVTGRLSSMMWPELGPVLQDGGVPVSGFARRLYPHTWPEMAAELLLTRR